MCNAKTAIVSAVLVLGTWFPFAGLSGPPSLRHTTVFDEYVEGEKQPGSAAEVALIEALMAEGVLFIDEDQARKIRSVTDTGQLMGSEVSPAITSLDADVIIGGVCKVHFVTDSLMGQKIQRWDASIQIKVRAVDTGEVIAAFTVIGEGMDFVGELAAQKAAKDAATKVAPKVVAAVSQRVAASRRIEIVVAGMGNVEDSARLEQFLQEFEGISEVRVLQSARGATKLSLRLDGLTSRDLALSLQGLGGLGLEVFGYTDATIQAEFSPAAVLDIPVLVGRFRDRTNRWRYAWMGRILGEIFRTELADHLFLAPAPSGTVLDPAGKDLAEALRSAKLPVRRSLGLVGRYSLEGKTIRVEATLVVGATGEPLRTVQAACEPGDIAACTIGLADELGDGLLDVILERRKALGLGLSARQVTEVSAAPSARPLRVREVHLENIFPARIARYAKHPPGTIILHNTGTDSIRGLVASFDLRGFSVAPVDVEIGELTPDAEARVPVKLVLDREALGKVDENLPAVVLIRLEYDAGEYHFTQSISRPVILYDHNAVDWKEPTSVAAFVTPRDSVAASLARALLPGGTSTLQNAAAFRIPMSLFHGLGAAGLTYRADPVNPNSDETLDSVRFPDETLSNGGGDCDDLTVLYASLLEAAGVPGGLVLTPGHVLAAFDTGIPAQARQRVSPDAGRYLVMNGTAWVPVETTRVGASFEDAWDAGTKEIRRWVEQGRDVDLIAVRSAWKLFPPLNLATASGTTSPVVTPLDATLIDEQLQALEARRIAEVEVALRDLDALMAEQGRTPELLNDSAVLLAVEGHSGKARTLLVEAMKRRRIPEVLNNLGNLDAAGGEPEFALGLYEEALALDVDRVETLLNSGMVLFSLHRFDDALDRLVRCIELGRDDLVLSLSRFGFGPAGTRAGTAREATVRTLPELIREALHRAGRSVPGSMDGTTRADDKSEKSDVPLEQCLYWL